MARPIRITDDFADKRGRELVRLIDIDIENRQPMIDKILKIRSYYYGDVERTLRYAGQVNLHLPVIAEKVENLTIKEMSALYGAEPFVSLQPPANDIDPDRTLLNEAYLNWEFKVGIPESYRRTQRWIRSKYLDGTSVIMPYYRFETRKGIRSEIVKKNWKAGESDFTNQPVPVDRPKLPIEILLAQFGSTLDQDSIELSYNGKSAADGQEFDSLEGLSARISFVEDRIRYNDVMVYFYDTKRIDEVELCIHREIVVYDGVCLENIEIEDFIVPFRAKSVQAAERVTRRYWLTISDIEKKRTTGEWVISDQDMTHLRAQSRSERQETAGNDTDRLKDQRDIQIGENDTQPVPPSEADSAYIDNKVMIYEVYLRDDADQDGQIEEYIYQIPVTLEKIVNVNYLEAIFPHGRRPFPALHGVQIDDRFYTLPIAQWLVPINEETDVILNQTHEAQEVITNPFFFYEPIAFGENALIQNGLHPGMGVPVASVKGILFPQFPQQPLANLQAIDSLLLFADRLTIAPQAVGSSQVRNAPRTARGTLALLSEGSAKIDSFIIEDQQSGWCEMMYQVHALYRHYGPDEKWFFITGTDKPKRIAKSDMDGKYEYIFSGNSTNTNKEVRRTVAIQRFQLLANDPAYLQNPVARRELIMDLLRHNSEGANIQRLDPGLGQQMGTHAPMTQEVELELIVVGQDIDVLPVDNDAEHIRVLDRFVNSRPFDMLQPWQVTLIASHRNKHVRQMLAKQATGATQGGTGAVAANNVPTTGNLDLTGGVA
jgi:hypothetical protein